MAGFSDATPQQSPKFDTICDAPLFGGTVGHAWSLDDIAENPEFNPHCLTDEELVSAMKKVDSSHASDFIRRFLYLIKGLQAIITSTTDNLMLLHIRLDILTMFIKILEQDPIFSSKDVLKLDPSTASSQEYLMEWVFDLMVSDHSLCSCYSILWLLLIRHGEHTSNGWYKYLHGKVIQIHSGKRRIVKGALDSIRAPTDLVNPAGIVNKSRLWRVYWSALVATTPLYEKNQVILGDSECSTPANSISRFSTVAWIIRNQFLGDTPPSEESIRHALESILALQAVWGAGVEVVHSLWLYFSRKLDSMTDLRSKDPKSSLTELHPFTLFSDVAIQAFLSHSTDVLNIIRVALPSLTRQGVANYFALIECLLRAVSRSPQTHQAASDLIEFVVSLFGGVEEAQLKWFCDWEVGRRCAALEALQNLLILGLHGDSCVNREFEESLTRLVRLVCRFREALVQQVKSKTVESGANVTNFTLLSYRDKLEQLALSLCQSLLPTWISRMEWLCQLLDAPLIDMLCSPVHQEWLSFLQDLLSSHCRCSTDCPAAWKTRLWSDVLPHFLSRACTNGLWAKEAAEVARLFLLLSLAPSSNLSPWDLLSWFVFKTELSFLFRRLFLRRLFNDSDLLNSLLCTSIIAVDVEQAWQFYTTWLTHKLLDGVDDCEGVPSLRAIECELPDGVSTLVDAADVEISFLRLCQRYEAVETFQERMSFKSDTLRRLTPLGQLLNSAMERFLTASTPSEVEITTAYRATASLFQAISSLLYSPDGVFTHLFNAFLLPPWRRLRESPVKKTTVQSCVVENLPAFLRGIAQLNFLKDPFIVRMLRELLRTVFFSVGAKAVASAVQMSDLTLCRAHLLKVLAQEFISHLDDPSAGWSENAKLWMYFFEEVDKGTTNLAQWLRDAPYLLWPVAALLADARNARSSTCLSNRCVGAFTTFSTRWKNAKSARDDSADSDTLRKDIIASFQTIYRLTTNPSTASVLNKYLKEFDLC
ncbi:hypothetical protein TcWFU_008031 [Taenia crassiceps]|uniref:Methyl methanesulfonate-sensitivity protein 22-like n=1 Tax=Taenia crassiceps TaxID=6207 RepID=A0ABR4QIS1_9CEST